MNRFKKIILDMQGKSKTNLIWLYQTQYNVAKKMDEPAKTFIYNGIKFWFSGTSIRNSEKLILFIGIDENLIKISNNSLPAENYLLGHFSNIINELSNEYINEAKSIREKAQFSAQIVNEHILKRNGLLYYESSKQFVLRINFNVPLLNAISINAKMTVKAIRNIIDEINKAIINIDINICQQYIDTYNKQQEIRKYLKEYNYCAFIANNSILPRIGSTNKPLINAIKFVAPNNLRIIINFSNGESVEGMGIRKGVTVITGGGYSGKSTLLNAIEMGIYNHIPGDGREYVITDENAMKIYSEDGRPVLNIDISPFFKFLPGKERLECFSTNNASGSVSQAANIIEAKIGKAKLLLIDEDRSATNFMIRDEYMREIIKNEPIIPFTDRVNELANNDISTILVIGGSSEYFKYADCVLIMDEFKISDITMHIKKIFPVTAKKLNSIDWPNKRKLHINTINQPFAYYKVVTTENQKTIIIDDYIANITHLTALVSDNQYNTLSQIILYILTDLRIDGSHLLDSIIETLARLTDKSNYENIQLWEWWFEEIRPIDIFSCLNRMRGLEFY